MPVLSAPGSVDRLSFAQIDSFPRLFTDYCAYHENLSPYFNGDFRQEEQFAQAAQRAITFPRNREALAQALLDQNERWGLSEQTRRNIERLRDPASVVVITGQQIGLFLSPLFIPYKTLTTLLLAESLEKKLGRPVIPVFWLAGEDHDFNEIASVLLPGAGKPIDFRYDPPLAQRGSGPVGRMPIREAIEPLLRGIEEALPNTEYKGELIEFLKDRYRPGVNIQDAFAFVMNRIFRDSGLVLVSPDDKRLKELGKSLFMRDIVSRESLMTKLTSTSEALDAAYHTQVRFRPTNLFLMDDASRIPIDAEKSGFHLRGQAKHFTEEELLELMDQAPERFSPNVILRPLTQDLLFPTVAYVAGPGEVSYYAQCKPAYDWAGIPMPIIYPRASITLLEASIARILDRYDLALAEYNEQHEKLFRTHVINHIKIDLDAVFETSARQLDAAVETIKSAAVDIDATLEKTAGSMQHSFLKELERFKGRIIKAQKRHQQEDRDRLLKAQNNLFPHGQLQERSVSPLHFLNKYGLDFFQTLMKDVSLDTTSHQVIRL